MTDKQIIIDDVDVSECSWYTQGTTGMICADWHISNDCIKNPNCYYKQLQRELMLKKEIDKYLYALIKLDNIPAHIKERVEAIWKQL